MRFWRKRTTETKALNGKVGRLCFFKCNFDTGCVEVAFFTSVQIAAKWFLTSAQPGQKLDFDFRPTWLKVIFYSRQVVGKLVLKILSNLGRIIFLHFFFEVVLKMPFSAATTWREKLLRSLPKAQIPSATTWEGLWTKCRSHRLSLEGVFQNLFQNPLINRS